MSIITSADRPPSATPAGVAWVLLITFLAGTALLILKNPFFNTVHSALFLILLMAAAVFAIDSLVYKVHRRPSTGLDFGYWKPSLKRSLVKLFGLLASMGVVGGLYWLFP